MANVPTLGCSQVEAYKYSITNFNWCMQLELVAAERSFSVTNAITFNNDRRKVDGSNNDVCSRAMQSVVTNGNCCTTICACGMRSYAFF